MTVSRVELGDAAPLEQQLLLTDVNRSEAQQTIFSARSEAALLELKTTIGLSTSDSLKLPQSFLLEPVFIPAARARGLTPIPPLAEIRQDIRRNRYRRSWQPRLRSGCRKRKGSQTSRSTMRQIITILA